MPTREGKLLILTDIDNGYALSLGLVLWLGDRLKELMKGRGLHLEQIHGNDGWFVPLPATFVGALATESSCRVTSIRTSVYEWKSMKSLPRCARSKAIVPKSSWVI